MSRRFPLSSSHVLVGVSTQEAADKLVEPVARLAQQLGAKILLVHVTSSWEDDQAETHAKETGEKILCSLAGKLREKDIECQTVMPHANDVASELARVAVEHQCTLIMLGLTGQQVLTRLIMGDVPSSIIHKVQIPVLLYPVEWDGSV